MGIESLEGQLNAKLLQERLNNTPPDSIRAVIADAGLTFVHDYEEVLAGFYGLNNTVGDEPVVLKEVKDNALGSGQIVCRTMFEPDFKDIPTWAYTVKTGAFVTRFTYENNDKTKVLEEHRFRLVNWMHTAPYINLTKASRDWPFEPEMSSQVVEGTSYEVRKTLRVKPKNMVLAAEERYRRNIIDGGLTLAFLKVAIGPQLQTS